MTLVRNAMTPEWRTLRGCLVQVASLLKSAIWEDDKRDIWTFNIVLHRFENDTKWRGHVRWIDSAVRSAAKNKKDLQQKKQVNK